MIASAHPPISLTNSSHTQYTINNNNTKNKIIALNNHQQKDHPTVAVPKQKNMFLSNADMHLNQRNTSSQDSGVHMDSANKQRTTLPYVTPSNSLTEVHKDRPISKKIIDYNPVPLQNRHFDVVAESGARRRQWGGKETNMEIMNRQRDVRNDKPWELPPLQCAPVKKQISRNEAAQFYLSSARYSPLTSGKKSGDSYKMMGFGSSAPRFVAESRVLPPSQSNSNHHFNYPGGGLKGVRINQLPKKETPSHGPRLVQYNALPSWLKFNNHHRSGQYILYMYCTCSVIITCTCTCTYT